MTGSEWRVAGSGRDDVVFLCGKGEGAKAILDWLWDDGLEVRVFTSDPAIDRRAVELGAAATTLVSVNDIHRWRLEPKLIVSCGYLDIITPAVIERVGGRVINCHYALLPNHRGRSSVPWAILQGDTVTGVTWHWIDPSIDTGGILLQATCQIEPDETQGTLFRKLDRLAAEYWPAALRLAMAGHGGVEQRGRTQYHKAGPPHGGVIDPAWHDDYVERFIRAMTHPPLPYATLGGVEVKTMYEYMQLRREEYARNGRYADA